MIPDPDSIVDLIHSIPTLTHSVALSTRTPTEGYNQPLKFMPDYGGVLEVPNSKLKINSIAGSLPFRKKSKFTQYTDLDILQSRDGQEIGPIASDCIIANSWASSQNLSDLVVTKAVEDTLTLNFLRSTDEVEGEVEKNLSRLTTKQLPSPILGIKQIGQTGETLLVKLCNSIKYLSINYSDSGACQSDDKLSSRQTTSKTKCTIKGDTGFQIKDACLSSLNRSILSVASDNSESSEVKIYDLSTSKSKAFHSLRWDSPDITSEDDPKHAIRTLRGRVVRVFGSRRRAVKGVQELDCIPNHLANMLITTGNQVALVDPRQVKPSIVYIDKKTIPSFYPTEFLRRTVPSEKNAHQIYSLTNVHLRVFDDRFPLAPMNQVNHMLDSNVYDDLNLKIVCQPDDSLEHVCASTYGRLCFLTFDQSQECRMVNPRSMHAPYHELEPSELEPSVREEVRMHGLNLIAHPCEKGSFSVVQMSSKGDVCIRKFSKAKTEEEHSLTEDRAKFIVHFNREKFNSLPSNTDGCHMISFGSEHQVVERLNTKETKRIDILKDEDYSDLTYKFESQRVIERFEKMMNKLDEL